jgi:CRISPR-associated protein Cas5d
MNQGVSVHVWGDRALFSRPEMKAERVSYDVITPSAARGILEAIHWKPAIRWVVDGIRVLRPIRFENVRRNEVASKASYATARKAMAGAETDLALYADEDRQQRASLILRDVAYVIDAHFEMTGRAGPQDSPGKHADTIRRRVARGQCVWQPCFGCREFPAWFEPAEGKAFEVPPDLRGERDLGWMLHDMEFGETITPRFFRAVLRDGAMQVPPLSGPGGRG